MAVPGEKLFGSWIPKAVQALQAIATRRVVIECDLIPYHYQHVPLKKLLNWIRIEAGIAFNQRKPWGRPTHLQIEPSSLCNLKCALCPIAHGLDRDAGFMSPKLFQRIIDEMGDYLLLIMLWDWGEPFLNPDIYDMIAYAKKRGIKVVSSTNGHLIDRRQHAQQLVASGIDSIIFAVDGVCQETYEQYRKSGHVETVFSGLSKVVAAKRAMNSKTPFINLRFIVMQHNEHEIPQLIKFARDLGVDALTLKTLNPHSSGAACYDKNGDAAFLPLNPSYQRFRYDPLHGLRIRRRQNPCKVLWNNPTIHWNGKVCPCTFDVHDRNILGDLNHERFADIWWGERYTSMREQFRTDFRRIESCANCTYAFEGGACATEIIAEAHFFTATRHA